MQKGEIKVTDKHGFIYRIDVEFWPETGVAIAYYKGERIASMEYAKAGYPPTSDNDTEWERWNETCCEWNDAAASDLAPMCREHFDRQTSPGRQ